jgi:hypothetical protein
MMVAGRLKPNPDRQAVFAENRDQAVEVHPRVRQRHPAAVLLAWDSDQHLVSVLGNVDAYQNARAAGILDLSHSRSPLWCGSQETTMET